MSIRIKHADFTLADADLTVCDAAVATALEKMAGLPEMATALVKQLAPEGRLAGAFSDRGVSRLVIGSVAGGSISLRTIVDADVAPLPGFSRPQAFTFSL